MKNIFKCINCDNQFSRDNGDVNRGRTKFCSMECSREHRAKKATEHANKILDAGKKQCKMCGRTRLLRYFPKSKESYTGYFSYCYDCRKEVNRKQDLKRSDYRKKISRSAYLKRTYGISDEDYHEMLEKQNGKCLICGSESIDRKHAVDHCHKTGKIRGLLCDSCNRGLGMFKDNPESLRKAASYVEGWW